MLGWLLQATRLLLLQSDSDTRGRVSPIELQRCNYAGGNDQNSLRSPHSGLGGQIRAKGNQVAYWHSKQFRDHGYLALIDGPAQRSVLKTLAEYILQDGTLKMSQKTLAKKSGESASSVNRALEQAEQFQLISRHRQGRRSAEVIRWHACPADCQEKKHTGKTDTAAPVISKESTADGFPKPKKKRAPKKTARVQFRPKEGTAESSQTDNTQTYQTDEKGPQLVRVTTLKDNPSLNTSKGVSKSSQTDNTQTYASLTLTLETLALDDDYEAVNSQVMLHLLNDYTHGLTVAALAVDVWGTIPQPLTHGHAEELVRHFETHTGYDAGPLYLAIYKYNSKAEGRGERWHHLSRVLQQAIVRKTDLLDTVDMSQVAGTLTETAPGYSFPPADVQKQQLLDSFERLNRATVSE